MSIQEKFEKNSEFTYGVHSGSLADHVPDNQATIMSPPEAKAVLKKLDLAMMGSVRSLNARFELLRQAIAYTLPYKVMPDGTIKFLVYLRNKRNNEGQLTMKLSLAPAGHVVNWDVQNYFSVDEDRDPLETDIISLYETLMKNLYREFGEEVVLTSDQFTNELGRGKRLLEHQAATHSYPIGFVMDSKEEKGYVGNIHFGALFATPITYNDTTFEMKEAHNTAVGWASAVDLLNHLKGTQPVLQGVDFEPWSEMVIKVMSEIVGTIRAVHNI